MKETRVVTVVTEDGGEIALTQEQKKQLEDAMPPPPEPTKPAGKAWAVGALKEKEVGNQGEEYLKQLARDIATNLVFTSHHIRESDQQNVIGMVFMPVAFGAFAECSKEYVNDIGMLYEYHDKSAPRSINGYPMFFSMMYLSKHDTKIVWEKVWKIRDALENI